MYGPTEAAVSVTSWRCERDYDRPTVPIGRPVANTQIYVLDAQLEPVPVGVWASSTSAACSSPAATTRGPT